MDGRTRYLSVPYLDMDDDGNTQRAWAHFRWNARYGNRPVSTRRIKRDVRKWVASQLGRTLHCTELRKLMKRVQSNSDAS